MDNADWQRRGQQALVVIAVVAVIGALYFAKSAVVPVLFAMFLALLLSPAVAVLRRIGVPRAIAAAIVVVSLVAVVGVGLNATWRPARDWLETAPRTMRTLERKLRPVTRFIAKVESVSEQAERVTDPESDKAVAAAPKESKSTVVNTQKWLIAVATTLMVTYFLLAAGPALLAQIEAKRGAHGLNTRLLHLATTISGDLGRYFAAVTVSSVLLGIGTTVTMYWLGMPNPLLWGTLAFLLNYVPYAGPATMLVLLTVVAVVSFDGLGKAFAVAGCFLAMTTVEGQVLQPVLVGRRLDVSPLVVFLSLWFGGWLWGIAGVALAVPLLVTAKALAIGVVETDPAGTSTPARRDSSVKSRAARLLAERAARLHRLRNRQP